MENSNEYQGYFLVDKIDLDGRPIIDGLKPLNAWHCGSCDRGQVYFVAWYKDGLIEHQHPDFATVVDFCLEVVELRMVSPVVQAILGGVELPTDTMKTKKNLVKADKENGLSPDKIIEKRAGILGDNFLGFTFDSVLAENPWIDPANVWRCNLGPTVES